MARSVTPMIHVPDVAATVEWYRKLGFQVVDSNTEDGVLDWAMLSFGECQVMFNAGGRTSTAERREVDLYVCIEEVDGFYLNEKDRLEIVEEPHDTFYGMREFIARDLNGFWITFGQDLPKTKGATSRSRSVETTA